MSILINTPRLREYELCRFTGTWETIETIYAESDDEAIADVKDFAAASKDEPLILFCNERWVLTIYPDARVRY